VKIIPIGTKFKCISKDLPMKYGNTFTIKKFDGIHYTIMERNNSFWTQNFLMNKNNFTMIGKRSLRI